jgi:hypothetical protein
MKAKFRADVRFRKRRSWPNKNVVEFQIKKDYAGMFFKSVLRFIDNRAVRAICRAIVMCATMVAMFGLVSFLAARPNFHPLAVTVVATPIGTLVFLALSYYVLNEPR